MKTTTKKMKKCGYFAGFAIVMFFLIVSSPCAFGQITIVENENDPAREVAESSRKYTHKVDTKADSADIKGVFTTLSNYGHFNTVNVSEGASNISPTGYLGFAGSTAGTLNIYEGRAEARGHIDTVNIGIGTGDAVFHNFSTGTVGTVNVGDKGRRIDVYNSAFIDTLNIDGADRLNNYVSNDAGGYIKTANIIGGDFRNYSNVGTMNVGTKEGVTTYTYNWGGQIDTLNVTGGWVDSFSNAHINTANISGGTLSVDKGSTADTVNVSDNGWLRNKGGFVKTVNFDGGLVESVGRIEEMVYTKGTYKTNIQYHNGTASIGTLTAAGTLKAENTWGLVENLNFQSDGSGQANIASYTSQWGTGFSGVKADNVDFTFGNILLDVGRIFAFDLFDDWFLSFVDMNRVDDISFATLFKAEEVANAWDLNSFTVSWGDDTNFGILNNGKFADGWSFNSDYTWFVYSDNSTSGSATPEPATLAMLGLGLVGLPLVNRLRKKQIVK